MVVELGVPWCGNRLAYLPDAAHVALVRLVQLPRQAHLDLALAQFPHRQHEQHGDDGEPDDHQVQSQVTVGGRPRRIDVELVHGQIVAVRVAADAAEAVAAAAAAAAADDALAQHHVVQADEVAARLAGGEGAAIVRRRTEDRLAGARAAAVADAQPAQVRSGYVERALVVEVAVHVDAVVVLVGRRPSCWITFAIRGGGMFTSQFGET